MKAIFEKFSILKSLFVFFIIALSLIFFHNMIFKNSKFLNNWQYDLTDSYLEDEFKILFEELKLKKDIKEGMKIKGDDQENIRKSFVEDENFAIKKSLQGNTDVSVVDHKKLNQKKNLKKELEFLIENIEADNIENETFGIVHESEMEFYDI